MTEFEEISRSPRVFRSRSRGPINGDSSEEGGRRFQDLIRRLQRRPFRLLVDFEPLTAVSPEVAERFLQGQRWALQAGLERDAFLVRSPGLQLQLTRLSGESGRLAALGPLRFFHDEKAALEYLLVP